MHKENAIQSEWHSTPEGQTMLQQFYNGKTLGRLLGILEQPSVHIPYEEVRYKIVLLGKSGAGKTCTVARLAGIGDSTSNHVGGNYHTFETIGIRITDIYWPVKIWENIILFKLTIWDPGANSFKKYSHIPLSCQDKADLLILMFSYNDANSFTDLISLVSKCIRKEQENLPGVLVIGTKNLSKIEVTKSEVQELQLKHNLHVITLPASTTGSNETSKISSILNTICEQLWTRDQHYIMNQNVIV